MATQMYGASDDLIEFDGDVHGEVGCYGTDDRASGRGCIVVFDDGTVADVKYGKPSGGIWCITVLRKGELFDRLDICDNEDADPYSDVLHLKDGAKKAWCGKEYAPVD